MAESTPTPLTLIVKTPSQKLKDISVECGLEWSVNRLKQHLSQIYPGHPVSILFFTTLYVFKDLCGAY